MFKKEWGDWTKYRELKPLIVDFHFEEDETDWIPYYERMDEARRRSLIAIMEAYEKGIPWVLFTHGWSTSRIGKTTSRSVVRGLMRSKDATPFIVRKNCIQHDSVFLAAIRPNSGLE